MKHLVMTSLILGGRYTQIDLAKIWGYKDYNAIRKGIITEAENDIVVLFVTKKKQYGATPYEDRLEGNILYMMGQKRHGTDKRIADNLVNKKDSFHLFYREIHHTEFIYYGKCALLSATLKSDEPSEFEFLLLDQNNNYDDENEIINYLVNIDVANNADSTPAIIEGAKKVSKHVRYERNPKNRKEAIRLRGNKCLICGFDYNKIYGKDVADSFIEVHHIKQLSKGEQKVDPAKDLIPICANCHRMLHRRRNDNISIEELKSVKAVERLRWYFNSLEMDGSKKNNE